jgi:hypothetical protein
MWMTLASHNQPWSLASTMGLFLLALGMSLQYGILPQRRHAIIYRQVLQGFIVLFYGVVSLCLQW